MKSSLPLEFPWRAWFVLVACCGVSMGLPEPGDCQDLSLNTPAWGHTRSLTSRARGGGTGGEGNCSGSRAQEGAGGAPSRALVGAGAQPLAFLALGAAFCSLSVPTSEVSNSEEV
jgi:hypothetical protein